MIVIQGVAKKLTFTIFSSNEEFSFNKKENAITFPDNKKQTITIANLFKEYKSVNKIILKIYDNGTLVSSSSYFRKEEDKED